MMGMGVGLEVEVEPCAETLPVTQEGGHGVTSAEPGPKKEVTKTSSARSEVAAKANRARASHRPLIEEQK
jgi:hypothetical protein